MTLVVNPGVSSLHIWFNSDPEVDCYLMKHYTLLRLAVAHCDVAILLLYFLIVPFLTSGFSARWNRLNCPLNCMFKDGKRSQWTFFLINSNGFRCRVGAPWDVGSLCDLNVDANNSCRKGIFVETFLSHPKWPITLYCFIHTYDKLLHNHPFLPHKL